MPGPLSHDNAFEPAPAAADAAREEALRLRGQVEALRRRVALYESLLEGMGVDVQALQGRAGAEEAGGTGEEFPEAGGHVVPVPQAQGAGAQAPAAGSAPRRLSPMEKVRLFRGLFAGRPDVHATRWESGGRSGFSPVCRNLWRPGVCQKPRGRCANCAGRSYEPLTERVVYDHLAGRHVVGLYPLCTDDACHLVCVGFEGAAWKEDALAFLATAREEGVPVLAEIVASGDGAHVWTFFEGKVPAAMARKLATALVSLACARHRVLDLSAYDHLWPCQDKEPRGGHLGHPVPLPLQKAAREHGGSVFADPLTLAPLDDPWACLQAVRRMPQAALFRTVERLCGQGSEFALAFDDTNPEEPWKKEPPEQAPLVGPRPPVVEAVLAGELFVKRETLTEEIILRLRRLAAFPNPEFFRAEALRLPVWDKPRVIACARDLPRFLVLPRGCTGQVRTLCERNGMAFSVQDRRTQGTPIAAAFTGRLRPAQQAALDDLLPHDMGVLSAPTAFGKTVLAAALVAARKVSTLVLVHRAELLRQWQERLSAFLALDGAEVGVFGGTRKKPGGAVDIAIMQSLLRLDDPGEWMGRYGQVIVDECHHVSAFTFEKLVRQARARYVTGLTATPVRRDGHQPIIFMQCGPIRHRATRDRAAFASMQVRLRHVALPPQPEKPALQALYRAILGDRVRNALLLDDIRAAFAEGRKILVLTERLEHLELLRAALVALGCEPWVLHGRQGVRERNEAMAGLQALDGNAPRIVLATGRLVGEGFDHPPLDTLVLAMPISWRGNLQQYAGRLHRASAGKRDVRIHDYVEDGVPMLGRMWERRSSGYRAMGYRIVELAPGSPSPSSLDALASSSGAMPAS